MALVLIAIDIDIIYIYIYSDAEKSPICGGSETDTWALEAQQALLLLSVSTGFYFDDVAAIYILAPVLVESDIDIDGATDTY